MFQCFVGKGVQMFQCFVGKGMQMADVKAIFRQQMPQLFQNPGKLSVHESNALIKGNLCEKSIFSQLFLLTVSERVLDER